MAAVVNGTSWAPGGEGTTAPMATLYEGDHTLLFNGTQSGVSPKTRGISVEIRNVVAPGSYPLGSPEAGGGSATYTESNGSIIDGDFTLTFYFTSATRTGNVLVTGIDLERQTITGTFSFEAARSDGGLVRVTAGEFNGPFTSVPGSP